LNAGRDSQQHTEAPNNANARKRIWSYHLAHLFFLNSCLMSSCCLSHASLLLPNHERNNTHDCQHRYLWNSFLMFWRPRHTWLPEYYVQFFSSLEAKTTLDCQRICLNSSPFVWEAIGVKDPCISLLLWSWILTDTQSSCLCLLFCWKQVFYSQICSCRSLLGYQNCSVTPGFAQCKTMQDS
jgi:hypothetical protein